MFTDQPQISPVGAALLGGHGGGGFLPPHPQPGQQGLPPGALLAMLLLHSFGQQGGPAQFAGPGPDETIAHGAPMQPAPMPGLRPPPVFQPPAQPAGAGVAFQPPQGLGAHLMAPAQPGPLPPGGFGAQSPSLHQRVPASAHSQRPAYRPNRGFGF